MTPRAIILDDNFPVVEIPEPVAPEENGEALEDLSGWLHGDILQGVDHSGQSVQIDWSDYEEITVSPPSYITRTTWASDTTEIDDTVTVSDGRITNVSDASGYGREFTFTSAASSSPGQSSG